MAIARRLLPSHLPRISLRAMASAPAKHEFLVIIPCKPGMQAKRQQVRPTHLQQIKPKVEAGIFKMGGPLLNSIPADNDPTNLHVAGSAIVCQAQSQDDVQRLLAEDIYATEGVWDLEKAQIFPFMCVFRNP